jgi:hypothetical protein
MALIVDASMSALPPLSGFAFLEEVAKSADHRIQLDIFEHVVGIVAEGRDDFVSIAHDGSQSSPNRRHFKGVILALPHWALRERGEILEDVEKSADHRIQLGIFEHVVGIVAEGRGDFVSIAHDGSQSNRQNGQFHRQCSYTSSHSSSPTVMAVTQFRFCGS